jgi:hypothetical protein
MSLAESAEVATRSDRVTVGDVTRWRPVTAVAAKGLADRTPAPVAEDVSARVDARL